MTSLSSSPPLDSLPRSSSYQPGEAFFPTLPPTPPHSAEPLLGHITISSTETSGSCCITGSNSSSGSSSSISSSSSSRHRTLHSHHINNTDSPPSSSPLFAGAASPPSLLVSPTSSSSSSSSSSSPCPPSSSASPSSLSMSSPLLSYHAAAAHQSVVANTARGEGVRLEGVPEGEDEQVGLLAASSLHSASRHRHRLRAEGESPQHVLPPSSASQQPSAAAVRSALLSGLVSVNVSSSAARSPMSAMVDDKAEAWQKLMNLKSLLSAGFITRSEYKERKSQLIDEMTGTTLTQTQQNSNGGGASVTAASSTFSVSSSRYPHPSPPPTNLPTIIPRAPPDFSVVLPERATKYTFDLVSRSWQATSVMVKLDPVPFSRGALRLVYHLQELDQHEPPAHVEHTDGRREGEVDEQHEHELSGASSIASDSSSSLSAVSSSARSVADCDDIQLPLSPRHLLAVKSANSAGSAASSVTYVAKISMDPRDNEDREIYFRDVEMQTLARYYAALFNEYNPPKLVDFVKASLLRLEEREGQPLCGVERYIEGQYRKWNNNFGFVSEDERNTPQAFSHFTYESSNHTLLICDIQGVSDSYTDPQLHSVGDSEQGGFGGKGNLGQRGIDRFLATHRCNAICRYLKLPAVNANYSDLGTLPVTQYMQQDNVKLVNIHTFPRTALTQQMLQPGSTQRQDDSALQLSSGPPLHLRAGADMEDQQCKGFCAIL